MSVRHAVVAGSFYSGDARELETSVRDFLRRAPMESLPREEGERRPMLVLLPHAGHVYCGSVMGAGLAGVTLPRRLIVLAPSHTGLGHPLGFWPDGAWETPLGQVPVDAALGRELMEIGGGFAPDRLPHMREHAVEVLLPFLQTVRPDLSLLPIVVGGAEGWREAAHALAELVLRHRKRPGFHADVPQAAGSAQSGSEASQTVAEGGACGAGTFPDDDLGLVISSDLNHYAPDRENRRLDALALEAFLTLDAAGLLHTARRHHISMCGVLPAAMGLAACAELGAAHARLAAYDTSASAFGDTSRVVGYAAARVW